MAWQPWRKSKAIPPRDVPYGKIERRISGSYLFWESDMAKFKVGDRVRIVAAKSGSANEKSKHIGSEHVIGESTYGVGNLGDAWIFEPTNGWVWYDSELEHTSPIRTVTRREIVPGNTERRLCGTRLAATLLWQLNSNHIRPPTSAPLPSCSMRLPTCLRRGRDVGCG